MQIDLEIAAFIITLLGVLWAIVKQSTAFGRLAQRVDAVEKATAENKGAIDEMMSIPDCEKRQGQCRGTVSGEIAHVHRDIDELKQLLRDGELRRDKAREDNEKWRTEMRDMLVRFATRLDEHLNGKEG